MTADESGLPPLDPSQVKLPPINTGGEIMKWLIRTVLELPDVTEEQRDEFMSMIAKIQFHDIMKDVSASLVEDLINDQRKRLNPNDEGEPTE